jgi:transcriptional regulator with XRE-family HTH domain
MSFADAVRAHRLRCGFSQEDLAAATGVAPRSIRNLEAGRVARPRPSTVRTRSAWPATRGSGSPRSR